jgi:hypothetical protein
MGLLIVHHRLEQLSMYLPSVSHREMVLKAESILRRLSDTVRGILERGEYCHQKTGGEDESKSPVLPAIYCLLDSFFTRAMFQLRSRGEESPQGIIDAGTKRQLVNSSPTFGIRPTRVPRSRHAVANPYFATFCHPAPFGAAPLRYTIVGTPVILGS